MLKASAHFAHLPVRQAGLVFADPQAKRKKNQKSLKFSNARTTEIKK
ncbi:MAG: hypothetical protein U1C58_13235 [Flavobacteriaceae bacterium]|nr:hypothetical protein [Flavobacteriaceae bacterium]MDZ4149247.1 hypothetical protein [Flavobacteriaceae bacterium]